LPFFGWRAFNYIEKGDIAPLGIVLLRLDVMVGERRGFGSALTAAVMNEI
jgi:hypothetical protein